MKPINVKLSKSPQSSFKFKKIELDSFDFNWHCHPEYEIMFMSKSRGKRFIGDNISFYREGDLFLIGSNLPHTWLSTTDRDRKPSRQEAILVQFDEHLAGLDFHHAPELQPLHRLLNEARFGLRFRGKVRDAVAREMRKMVSMDEFERFIQLLSILNLLSKARDDEKTHLSSIEFANGLQYDGHSRIDRVCTYINNNYKSPVTLEAAAEIANMSTNAFSRFFKRSTGNTFVEYVNKLRIGQACKLLAENELTIAEICYEVGFNNISNFNRQFRKHKRTNPRQYRNEFLPSLH